MFVYVYARVHSTTSHAPGWRKIQFQLAKKSHHTFPSFCQQWMCDGFRHVLWVIDSGWTLLVRNVLCWTKGVHLHYFCRLCHVKVPHQWCCAKECTEQLENFGHSVLGKKPWKHYIIS